MSAWKWQGHAGHFCMADRCRWHMNTVVGAGKWLVSSVGDLYVSGEREALGLTQEEGFYETFVFPAAAPLECGCVEMQDASEVASERYATCTQAVAGHLAMCEKFDAPEVTP